MKVFNSFLHVPISSKKYASSVSELFIEFRERNKNGSTQFIKCDCLPNCEDTEIVVETKEHADGLINDKWLDGMLFGMVMTKKYPQIRYYRQQLFTFTDLLISIGGAAGLFIGFSVKGLLQIIHHFTWRLITFRQET